MRNMLALFAAVLLTVVGLGWYLDWYKVRSQPASVPGQHSVGIDINTNKIGTDLQKGEHKIQQMIENKGKDEAKNLIPDIKKTGDLTLPSPELRIQTDKGSALQLGGGDKGSLFEFHSDKGPMIQFGATDKGPLIQIGTTEKKPSKP